MDKHQHQFIWTGTGISIPGADGQAPSLAVHQCECGERISVISNYPMSGSDATYAGYVMEGELLKEPSKTVREDQI